MGTETKENITWDRKDPVASFGLYGFLIYGVFCAVTVGLFHCRSITGCMAQVLYVALVGYPLLIFIPLAILACRSISKKAAARSPTAPA